MVTTARYQAVVIYRWIAVLDTETHTVTNIGIKDRESADWFADFLNTHFA